MVATPGPCDCTFSLSPTENQVQADLVTHSLVLSSTFKGNACTGKEGFGTEVQVHVEAPHAAPQQRPGPAGNNCQMVSAPPLLAVETAEQWAPSCHGSLEFSKSQLPETNFSVSGNAVILIKPNTWHVLRML